MTNSSNQRDQTQVEKSFNDGYVYAVAFGELLKVGYSANNPQGRIAAHTSFAKNVLGLDVSRVFVSESHYKPRATESVLIKSCSALYQSASFGKEWFIAHDGGAGIFCQLENGSIPMRKATAEEVAAEESANCRTVNTLFGAFSTRSKDANTTAKTSIGTMLQNFALEQFGEMTLPEWATEEELKILEISTEEAPAIFGVIGDCLNPAAHGLAIYGVMEMMAVMRSGVRHLECENENHIDHDNATTIANAIYSAYGPDSCYEVMKAVSAMFRIMTHLAKIKIG